MGLDRGKRFARCLCNRESPEIDPMFLRKADRSCLSLPAVETSSLPQTPMKHSRSHCCQAGGWRSLAGSRPCPGARTRLGPWLSAYHAWHSAGACPWQPHVRPHVPCVPLAFALKLSSLSANFSPKPGPRDGQHWCASSFVDVPVMFVLCFRDH